MTSLFKFDFYTRDWFTGTRGMSLKARAVYIDLLVLMYERGGPIPDDRRELCRTMGIYNRRTLDPIIDELIQSGKIISDAKTLSNKRAILEIEGIQSRMNRASKGGKAKPRNDDRSPSKSLMSGTKRALRVPEKQGSIDKKQTLNVCKSPSPSPSPAPIEEERDAPSSDSASNIVPISTAENTSTDTGRKYVFDGQAVKLNENDLTTWRKNFHGIPDIESELRAIDGWFERKGLVGDARPPDWFQMTSNMLNKAHQKYLAEKQKPKKPVSEMSYFERLEAGII